MEKKEKRRIYSDTFKLSVLKDMYENDLSYGETTRKYGLKWSSNIKVWEKRFPLDAKSLSLSLETINKVMTMRKKKEESLSAIANMSEEEKLRVEVANLRKALQYSELRNEAFGELLKIGKEEYGIDLLKKAGTKQ